MKFEISELRGSTVWQLYRMRSRLQLDPSYQRLSGIWPIDKRQLLIDTILNGFDVPKLYFHKFTTPKKIGSKIYDYAIIDGKQRLETIWSFIDGHIALDDAFTYFDNSAVAVSGMTYSELAQAHPDLKADFDGFPLAVICVETDEIEMIEEMFSRLNEAAPLTAPEKRNAFGGPIPVAVRKLAKEEFFARVLPFPNKRYRHFDLVTKFLQAEYVGKVVDTKKVYLDSFVREFSAKARNASLPFVPRVRKILSAMSTVFVTGDSLLRQVGMVTLYYHLFRYARAHKWKDDRISRKKLIDFENLRQRNRANAEGQAVDVDYELVEFDGYAQSPNDSSALKFRLRVLLDRAFGEKVKQDDL